MIATSSPIDLFSDGPAIGRPDRPGVQIQAEPAATTAQPEPATPKDGAYLAQVTSQKNEADAQASYRALQGKFPTVLRSPLIKRVDLGDKGVYFRAMVGPFSSTEEAAQFCADLKTVGGPCIVQRN